MLLLLSDQSSSSRFQTISDNSTQQSLLLLLNQTLNQQQQQQNQQQQQQQQQQQPVDVIFIAAALVYGLTFLVGTLGNSLIVYSVNHFRRMKSLSNVFLSSLATADLILIVFCIPVKFAQLFSFSWTFGEFSCKLVHYIHALTAFCSVYTLTAMSIERYYAVIHPVKCRYICTMSQTKRIIAFVWLASICFAMPVFWIQDLKTVGDGSFQRAFWCVRDWDSPIAWRLYEVFMLACILCLPLIVMSYSYYKICSKLYSVMHSKHRTPNFQFTSTSTTNNNQTLSFNNQNTSNISTNSTAATAAIATNSSPSQLQCSQQIYIDSSAKKMSQVIQMLIVVVIIFVLCWTPILLINVLAAFKWLPHLNYGIMYEIKITAHLLSYANSCVNPIIYGFMSRNFRSSFREALVTCLGCRKSSAFAASKHSTLYSINNNNNNNNNNTSGNNF